MSVDLSEPVIHERAGGAPDGGDFARRDVRSAAARFVRTAVAGLALFGLLAAAPVLRTVGAIVILFVIVPLLVVTWLDLAHALRGLRSCPAVARLATIPEAMLGVVAMTFGLAIMTWVLYNELVERQPEYRSSFFTFGVAPALLGVGALWLRRAFPGRAAGRRGDEPRQGVGPSQR